MDTPFAIWVESFPYEITTATIETFRYKHMYFNFLETDSALDPTDSPEPSMSFEDFCEALDDIAMQKAVETLAGLPFAMLIAALDAGEAVNEIDDDNELDEDDIAAEYGITPEVLDHVLTLMNHDHGLSMLYERRAAITSH